MSRFLAVHTMPMTEEQFMGKFTKTPPTPYPKDTSWKQTYCGFKDGKFFCEWEAASKEVIEEYFKTIKMPFDAVYPVRLYNTSTKKLEK